MFSNAQSLRHVLEDVVEKSLCQSSTNKEKFAVGRSYGDHQSSWQEKSRFSSCGWQDLCGATSKLVIFIETGSDKWSLERN